MTTPDLILHNGRLTTLDPTQPEATALAVTDGRIGRVGSDAEIVPLAGPRTRIVDAGGRRVIPGLSDSHIHVIRGGLNYNLELRWDGVRSLADAMAMLKAQVVRTPAPQWVRVVGGFTEHQFEGLPGIAPDAGPVLVQIEYLVAAGQRAAFLAAAELRHVRHRAGAGAWGLYADPLEPGRFVECFTNPTWLAHQRQHLRMSRHDEELLTAARAFHTGEEPPRVLHLVGGTALTWGRSSAGPPLVSQG